jgi:hypothetical protein
MEASGSAWLLPGSEVEAVSGALENFGVLFVPEDNGIGAGVRLRFTRQDVRQISAMSGRHPKGGSTAGREGKSLPRIYT